MIDKTAFEKIRADFDLADQKREDIITRSRDILKASKHAIYSIHRDDLAAAKEQLAQAKKLKLELEQELETNPELRGGAFSSAIEEYVEGCALLIFVEEERIPSPQELEVRSEEYLLGLADLTGELGRRAVLKATARDAAAVKTIKEALDTLYGEFVKFDFRNGDLRRKYDSIKYNLQKVERMLYDLTMNGGNDEEDS